MNKSGPQKQGKVSCEIYRSDPHDSFLSSFVTFVMKHVVPHGMSAVHIKVKVNNNTNRSGLHGFFVVFVLLSYELVQNELPMLVHCIFLQNAFLCLHG